jgi:hypothetical protein
MGNPRRVRGKAAACAERRTFLGLVAVEVAVRDCAGGLQGGDDSNADNRLGDVSDVHGRAGVHAANLDGQQEEVEVEVDAGKNVFVRRRHQDGGAAVCENGEQRRLGDGR